MRVAATVLAILGGLFVLLGVNPGSVTANTPTRVLSDWVTIGGAVLAIAGGAAVLWRPPVGTGLIALALASGALSAPAMVPAIQDMLIIPYLLGALLALVATLFGVIAWVTNADQQHHHVAGGGVKVGGGGGS